MTLINEPAIPVGVLVQPIHQVDDKLVRVLLVTAREGAVVPPDDGLEAGGTDGLVLGAPEARQHLGEVLGDVTPGRAGRVQVLLVGS